MSWGDLRFPLKDDDLKVKSDIPSKKNEIMKEEKDSLEIKLDDQKNVVYVGNKPPMNYVLAAITQLNSGAKKVAIKARGRAISRAVDVAEIVRRRFVPDAQIEEVKIFTEELTNDEGNKVNVSCIEIYLTKP